MGATTKSIGWEEQDENTLIVNYWLDFQSAREAGGRSLFSQSSRSSDNPEQAGDDMRDANVPEPPAKFGTG
jgi:hypothetical protein